RQDAIVELLNEHPLDLMLVVGGYNSSNTCNLARICAERVPTFHVAEPRCLVSADEIRHRPVTPATQPPRAARETVERAWLPAGRLRVGLTAGASTPNSIIGETVERLVTLTA
ncbi:MAG: 4-hydroxy-3-methylbut-2-enyl diphosphate reductase, partial [Vicinamibacteraceae bacterium]